MKIAEKSKVALSYALTVDGAVVDQSTPEKPLEFITSIGMLLPAFEANIAGKEAGEAFAFTLTPEEGYGALNPEAVVELPKDIFMVDGEVVQEATVVGNVLPMGDNQGNRMMGTIKAVNENTITMDFNHPMAGKVLNFTGVILEVRDVTPADLMPQGGGCSCGGGDCSSESCGCEDREGDSCSCGC